jgi:hypothetical protein
LYKSAGIHVDENWVNEISQDNDTAEHNEDGNPILLARESRGILVFF